MKTTDKQLQSRLRHLMRESAHKKEGSRMIEEIMRGIRSSSIRSELVLPAERLSISFNVERVSEESPRYEITPVVELKSSKPLGDYDLDSPLRPFVRQTTGDGKDLGFAILKERTVMEFPLGGGGKGLIEKFEEDPSKGTPLFGASREEAILNHGELGLNIFLSEIGKNVGAQIPLIAIDSEELSSLEAEEVFEAIVSQLSKIFEESFSPFLDRSSSPEREALVSQAVTHLGRACREEMRWNGGLMRMIEELLGTNWSRKRSEGYRLKMEPKELIKLGPLVDEFFEPLFGESFEAHVLPRIKDSCPELWGGTVLLNRSPRRGDGSPVWEDRKMIPFLLKNTSPIWVSDSSPPSRGRALEVSLLFSSAPPSLIRSEKSPVAPPPSSSPPSSKDGRASTFKEPTASEPVPDMEPETAPLPPSLPPSSFPNMERWFELVKIKTL